MNSAIVTTRYNDEQMHLLKTQIAPKCTDDELALFCHVAQRRGLDPFARQIYAMKRRTKENGEYVEKMTIQTGIDGFRLIAKRAGLDAIDDIEFRFDPAEKGPSNPFGLVSATATVWPRGAARPTKATAFWDEYRQLGNNGLTSMWRDKGRTMLGKCAEALALRKAFPEELSGLSAAEEMDQADAPRPISRPMPVFQLPENDTLEEAVLDWQRKFDGAETLESLSQLGEEAGRSGLPDTVRGRLRNCYAAARARLAPAEEVVS